MIYEASFPHELPEPFLDLLLLCEFVGINCENSLNVMVGHKIYNLIFTKEDFIEINKGLIVLYDLIVRVE